MRRDIHRRVAISRGSARRGGCIEDDNRHQQKKKGEVAQKHRARQAVVGVAIVDAVSVDTAVSMRWAAKALGVVVAVQGNLDPIALVAGGNALDTSIDRILAEAKGTPFIFNLGHGVLPETPVEHMARLVDRVRRHA